MKKLFFVLAVAAVTAVTSCNAQDNKPFIREKAVDGDILTYVPLIEKDTTYYIWLNPLGHVYIKYDDVNGKEVHEYLGKKWDKYVAEAIKDMEMYAEAAKEDDQWWLAK